MLLGNELTWWNWRVLRKMDESWSWTAVHREDLLVSQCSASLVREIKATGLVFSYLIKYGQCHVIPWDTRWMPMNLWGEVVLFCEICSQCYQVQACFQSFFFMVEAVFEGRDHVLTFGFLTPCTYISGEHCEREKNLEQGFLGCWGVWKLSNFMRGFWVQLGLENLEYSSLSWIFIMILAFEDSKTFCYKESCLYSCI